MSSGYLFRQGLDSSGQLFERVRFGENALDEAWLRDTICAEPDLIPLAEAFPGTGGVSTVCTEMPLGDGASTLSLDVFGMTPDGRPVLVECKLWRNPEARRKVVAQILEYSALLRTLSYGSLEARLKRKLGWTGENPLYHHVRTKFPGIDQIAFTDGVTQNLESGNFLLLIAGDGIRTDAQTLVRLLKETGLVGSLTMMEIKLWRDPTTNTFFAAPTIPTRVDVERYRVYLGSDNRPIEFESSEKGATDHGEGARDGDESRRRDPQAMADEKAFWTDLLNDLSFDNPEQDLPVYRYPNHARAPLPSPARRLVLYRTKKGQIGVFIVVEHDDKGQDLVDALLGQIDEIQEEMELPVQAADPADRSGTTFKTSTSLKTDVNDLEQRQAEWLRMASNRMVNAFRPRIDQFNGF